MTDPIVKFRTWYDITPGFTGVCDVGWPEPGDPDYDGMFGEPCGICYLKDGKLHREDGPAMEGPAPMFGKRWYLNGVQHRVGGPWITNAFPQHFDDEFYIFGQRLTKEEYFNHPLMIENKLDEIKKL